MVDRWQVHVHHSEETHRLILTTAVRSDCRDLIRNILQVDPGKRLTIAQILAHSWFTSLNMLAPPNLNASQASLVPPPVHASPSLELSSLPIDEESPPREESAGSAKSESTFHSASSEFSPSGPTTPDDVPTDPFYAAEPIEEHTIQRNSSEATIRKATLRPLDLHKSDEHPEAVPEAEEQEPSVAQPIPLEAAPSRASVPSQSSKAPPALPIRTPVRTKRRSVSSTLSESMSPNFDKASSVGPPPDFSSLLSTPAPLIFSTPLERELLNALSVLGFDTGQIVHSVLSDACDATGSLWWMLKRRAEKKALEDGTGPSTSVVEPIEIPAQDTPNPNPKRSDTSGSKSKRSKAGKASTVGRSSRDARVSELAELAQAHSAPELQFIPATPTAPSSVRPDTPPQARTPPNPLLSPSSTATDLGVRSQPSTPGGSLKDKDGSKGRKVRSGSVSIMQRATTALEAAGIVRKKSTDAVRDEKEKEKEKEREKEKEKEKRLGSGEETRTSHGSASGKLVKTPPMKAVKDSAIPMTPPPPNSMDISLAQGTVGSPWVLANTQHSPPSSRAESPGDTLSALPNISAGSRHRNRGSLLSTFRMWFKEDAKGKRKEEPVSAAVHALGQASAGPSTSPVSPRARAPVRRRQSSSRGKVSSGRKTGPRTKRASMSSRRSSSVNSRRSSVTSNQYNYVDSPSHGMPSEPFPHMSRTRSDASRRSFGSHTPISDREDYVSRPSSIQSFIAQPRHRKSPSASSAGSLHLVRTSSPLPKFHRRAGSGSSTRVVRQVHPQNSSGSKPPHLRSNSASSAHSLASSRPGSLYDLSENESKRNSSPIKTQSRHSFDDTPRRPHGLTTFVAHKRQTPFSNPNSGGGYLNSIGRTSWKKSWGMEPPGWQSRAAHPAIEVLSISPPDNNPLGIRDVFTGRQSLNLGDESDWVDEDDDEGPAYAGGLGQMPSSATTTSHAPTYLQSEPLTLSISSHLRNNNSGRASSGKRSNGSGNLSVNNASGRSSRGRTGHSPVGRSSPLPPSESSSFESSDARGGRRQLPAGRSGPAFRHPIQEEDEGEEE